jgi:predicted AAA+ superfamily ATPase
MYRTKIEDLKAWKNSPLRKPLILSGARQVGKTWLLQKFGKAEYAHLAYINFEETSTLQNLFAIGFDIDRILTALQIQTGVQIQPENTLLVLDEIQAVQGGLTSLKYFAEKAPQYHIIAAGSLLGMNLHLNESFPVGKVDFLDLRPLSFAEFLIALGENELTAALLKKDWVLLSLFSEKLKEYLRYYFFVGGMPEAVAVFTQNRNWQELRQVQYRLLRAYEADFSKHVPHEQVPRVRMVWQSIPAQLAKENKKFMYGVLKEGARAKEFELAIQWLVDSGLLLKSYKVSKPFLPLTAYQDVSAFKLFLLDVGLLSAMAGLNTMTVIEGNKIFTEFKGALTEQYVMQQLRLNSENYIGYWANDRSTAEVDFVVQRDGEVIPIEVKAGENLRAKSFKLFCDQYEPQVAVRVSLADYKPEPWMVNIPLYGIDERII